MTASFDRIVGIVTQPTKIDLDKKWLPKQKTIQNFNIDALGFKKTRNENPPMREIGVTSNPCQLTCQPKADWPVWVSW